MGKNIDKDIRDVAVELGGRKFNRVKNGIDEAEITSFINELVTQRDELLQREEHLASLTKLAEKTITEADKLAEDIKAQAREQAETEVSTLIADAEEKSQKAFEEKHTEIVNNANAEAANIISEAEQKAGLLLDSERRRIQPELSNFVQQLSNQLVSELESLKNQAVSLGASLDQYSVQSVDENTPVIPPVEEVSDVSLIFSETEDPTNTEEPEDGNTVAVVADDQYPADYESEPEWEIEILPPMDIMKVMVVVTHLDKLPEVEKTEIIPRNDKPSIIVYLREPIQLVEILRNIPEVANVEEETKTVDDKPNKVQISLIEKTVPQEAT